MAYGYLEGRIFLSHSHTLYRFNNCSPDMKKSGFKSHIKMSKCSIPHLCVASSIPARSHTFVEIDHEIISTVILLPSAESFKKGCCQLQAKVFARNTG